MNKDLMRAVGLGEAVDRLDRGECSWCGVKVRDSDFRDKLSEKEYYISGLCMKCQDDTFVDEDEIDD